MAPNIPTRAPAPAQSHSSTRVAGAEPRGHARCGRRWARSRRRWSGGTRRCRGRRRRRSAWRRSRRRLRRRSRGSTAHAASSSRRRARPATPDPACAGARGRGPSLRRRLALELKCAARQEGKYTWWRSLPNATRARGARAPEPLAEWEGPALPPWGHGSDAAGTDSGKSEEALAGVGGGRAGWQTEARMPGAGTEQLWDGDFSAYGVDLARSSDGAAAAGGAADDSEALAAAAISVVEREARAAAEAGRVPRAPGAGGQAQFVWSDLGEELRSCAWRGKGHFVRELLARGADPDYLTAYAGWRPLHYAAFNDHAGVCESLLEAGAARDAANHYGQNALHLAACRAALKAIPVLLRAGVDAGARDAQGCLPLEIAHRLLMGCEFPRSMRTKKVRWPSVCARPGPIMRCGAHTYPIVANRARRLSECLGSKQRGCGCGRRPSCCSRMPPTTRRPWRGPLRTRKTHGFRPPSSPRRREAVAWALEDAEDTWIPGLIHMRTTTRLQATTRPKCRKREIQMTYGYV